MADTPDTLEASWEFPGFVVQYRYRGYNSFHHLQSRPNNHGIAFHGSQATLVLDRSGYEIWAEGNAKERAEVVAVEESYFPGIVNRGEQDGAWHRTFLDCARDRKSPPLPFELSHEATACCLLGNISYLTGRKIRWDGERGRILGDDIAMGMLDTPRRPGWDLPQI